MTVALLLVSDKVRWWDCEGGSDGPQELSYALWGHGGRGRRPKDGPEDLGRRPAAARATLERAERKRPGSGARVG